jgi:uncharacterized protein YeaO (DUF488 family)
MDGDRLAGEEGWRVESPLFLAEFGQVGSGRRWLFQLLQSGRQVRSSRQCGVRTTSLATVAGGGATRLFAAASFLVIRIKEIRAMIQLKRAYETPSPDDGFRVLVEPFWPRDLTEKHAKLGLWLREVAPSAELHQAFGENPAPERWEEFQRLYLDELKDKHKSIQLLREKCAEGTLTLVHAGHSPDHNGATVLKRFLEKDAGTAGKSG